MPENTNQAPMPPSHFLIPVQVAQGILGYLGKQPYNEVAGFINVLSSMKQAEFPPLKPFPPKGPDDPGGATGNNGKDATLTEKTEKE